MGVIAGQEAEINKMNQTLAEKVLCVSETHPRSRVFVLREVPHTLILELQTSIH